MDARLSSGARAALFSLTSMQSQISALQKRLATGKKVNSAVDNPRAFFASSNLSARADVLNSLSSSVVDAQSTIGAASNGIAAIRSLLSSVRSVAAQALQSSASALASVTGTNSSVLSTSSIIASFGGSSTRFRSNDTVSISDGTTTAVYTASSGDTVQTFLNAINNTSGLKVTASLNGNGKVVLTATDTVDISVSANLAGAGGGTLTGIIGLTAGTTSFSPNTSRQNLAAQFDDMVGQIDDLAFDSGINGFNLLTGSSLTVGLGETGSSSVTVSGTDLTSSGLGIGLSLDSFQTDDDINAAIAAIDNAIEAVDAAAVSFGSMGAVMQARKDFNSAMINTLTEGADALTATDINEDSAMLLALQTRQQLAATTLSLTSGADGTALALFGLSR